MKIFQYIPRLRLLIGLLIAGLLICSCSTRKNTFPNRAYHTTTSHFNINFNGKEALKRGETELAEKVKDNYTMLLPIFPHPTKEEAMASASSFDKAIEKASKSIYKHSMLIKGKEYVKTIDDAYLMMGKAYFYKQDYVQASRVFSYIINTHKGHSCWEEAMVWAARSAMEQKYYSRAEDMLINAEPLVKEKKSKKLNALFAATAAQYQLTAPNGETQTAIDHINDVLTNRASRQFKTRMYFILGQIYESLEQLPEAQSNFAKVIKRTPAYDMEFSARMHLATNYDGTLASRVLIMRELKKMLDEEKNEPYRDQIYYAMSEIARIDGNEKEQIKNLAQSVASFSDNHFQRTQSSLKLADIYFDNEQYVEAQNYYDTAMLSMPKEYPNYELISNKAKILRDLVQNLEVIHTQDSLQRIAKMTPQQRTNWVNKQISMYKAEKQRKEKEEADKELALQQALGMSNIYTNTKSNSGGWYFYNTSLVAAGRTEFLRRWGTRKLEDNWRISNKQQISFEDLEAMNDPSLAKKDTVELDEDGNPIKKREEDPSKPEYYTQDLPLTPGAIDTSNMMIADAMYNAGLIYIDQLSDLPRGNDMLEKLLSRFPDHELALPARYMLYLNYTHAKDPKGSAHKDYILTKYADTDYARLIVEPDYYEKLARKNKHFEERYEEVYELYCNKQWKQVVGFSDEIIPQCTDKALQSKYAYLRAVAVGQVSGEEKGVEAMKAVASTYSGTEVAQLAKIYLSNFKTTTTSNATAAGAVGSAQEAVIKEQPFVYLPDEQHFIVMIVNVHEASMMDVKKNIADYNKEFYNLQKFNIKSFYINQNEQMVTISKFKNKEAAMLYYSGVIKDSRFLTMVANLSVKVYALSATNYTTYYNLVDKRHLYDEFFKTNYIDKK